MNTATKIQTQKIIGIQVKTSNDGPAMEDIPALWQKFYQEATLDKMHNKLSGDIYAVYTDFPNPGLNNEGEYSFILGAAVNNLAQVPPGFVSTELPESNYRSFPVTGGPEKVFEKWQEIWRMDFKEQRTFIADFELYKESGEVEILLGIK